MAMSVMAVVGESLEDDISYLVESSRRRFGAMACLGRIAGGSPCRHAFTQRGAIIVRKFIRAPQTNFSLTGVYL